jgi:hypothetical protein
MFHIPCLSRPQIGHHTLARVLQLFHGSRVSYLRQIVKVRAVAGRNLVLTGTVHRRTDTRNNAYQFELGRPGFLLTQEQYS